MINKTRVISDRTNHPGFIWLKLLRRSFNRFYEMRALESASALAYYALFSLFPLMLILTSLAGYLVGNDVAYARVVGSIRSALPFSGDVLDENMREVIRLRGPVGLLGIVVLLWSASGFFSILAYGVNRAWPMVKLRTYVQNRLIALGMIAVLFLLLILSLLSSTLINQIPTIFMIFDNTPEPLNPGIWRYLLPIIPALFTLIMFMTTYRWMPNKTVHWRAVLPGAAMTTFVWEMAKEIFSMYLGSGVVRYEMVYGSLGALIALMLWIYFSCVVALFGAYLVASLDQLIDHQTQPARQTGEHLPAETNEEKHELVKEHLHPAVSPEAIVANKKSTADHTAAGHAAVYHSAETPPTHPPKRVHG